MTRRVDVIQEMGLWGEVSPFGRWVRLRGEQGLVYVAQAAFGQGYYSWCDTPHGRAVEPYLDPTEAIQAGLQRKSERAPGFSPVVDRIGASRRAPSGARRLDPPRWLWYE